MNLNSKDLSKIALLVNQGYGSRKIAKALGNKVSFQAVAIHVKRIKDGSYNADLSSKLDVIFKQLVGIEQKLGIIPEGEVVHPFFNPHPIQNEK